MNAVVYKLGVLGVLVMSPRGGADDSATPPAPQDRKQAKNERKPAAPSASQDLIAAELTAEHGDRLLYAHEKGQWFRWTGTRYAPEPTLEVFDLARAKCREEAARHQSDKKLARHLSAASTVAGVVALARADRTHATTLDAFDRDPFLLNTPAATVSFSSNKAREHQREDRITKVTAVAAAGPRASPPRRWLEFLKTATGGDEELVDFLQRVTGYALTGDTREHAIFFLYGTGGNGKGVFLNTVSGILADYAKIAPIETFTATHGDRHPTELAMLQGARLVVAQETEEGRQWAESRLKSLSGGDPISARFMRRDFFTFQPQFKLLIAGNHKPGLKSVDEAMRRRLHLIPFTATIPSDKRDPELGEKLRAEWPKILRWMIAGCKAWRKQGLKPPKAVLSATQDYFDSEEPIGLWLADNCSEDHGATAIARHAYVSWRSWCQANGEEEGSERAFAKRLERRGFQRERTKAHRRWRGFELNHSIGLGEDHDDG